MTDTRDQGNPGECQEPGCHLPAAYCERHSARTREVIEEVIRELEFEQQGRWTPIIERLRGLLS
jgi:hypothetical protein